MKVESVELVELKRIDPYLIKEPTCFKNHENPSCIDLILTNFPRHFQNSMAVETGLSDCHKMILTVMKSQYEKLKPKLISYRKYNNFSNDIFRVMVIEKMQGWNMQDITLDILKQILMYRCT